MTCNNSHFHYRLSLFITIYHEHKSNVLIFSNVHDHQLNEYFGEKRNENKINRILFSNKTGTHLRATYVYI